MDWLTSSRPLKNVKNMEFYQRKVLSFLFSAEGRDDFRTLSIPLAQLGFYSPMHFISCIPLEMCEPFKSDKLFLEEPSWEPGQEIYYKPEKRWATILSHETNQRGRPVVLIKMDGTNVKKEKTIGVPLQDLQENGAPLRIPKRFAHVESTLISDTSSSGSIPSTPDDSYLPPMLPEENERETIEVVYSPTTTLSSSAHYATVNKKPDSPRQRQAGENRVTFEQYKSSPVTPAKRFEAKPEREASPPPLPNSPPPSKEYLQYNKELQLKGTEISYPSVPIRKKSSKRSVRPATEYFPPPSSPPALEATSSNNIYQDPDALKFKSCNNLVASDDDLEPFELVNYTNSLRSSARKVIQKQLAHDAQNRAASLKLRPTSSRPHVAEIFTWDNEKMKMTKRLEPVVSTNQPIYTKPITANTVTVSSTHNNNLCNNLSKCQSRSQPDMYSNDDQADSSISKSYSRPSSSMQHPFYNQQQLHHKPNPLEFNFAPLSSSELVKQQLAVVNRVLEHQPKQISISPEYSSLSPVPPSTQRQPNELTGISSDSSSHDNDSGRGSYQYIPETIKESERMAMVNGTGKHRLYSNDLNKISASGNMENNMTNALNKRYTKNRSTSRSNSLPRHMSSKDEREFVEEEHYNIPMPFHPGNIASVSGYGKGIQGATNSSYADATLCALFTCSNIFDMDLLFSKPGQIERGIKKEVRKILREKIVACLRLNAYCKSENVSHLREAMLPLSSKMHSPLMDAQEFLYLLFDSALNTESFIEFSNVTKDFMHQIIARPKDRSKSQTVQFMLETSLGTSGLKFKQVPSPALFLCMPRCKGRLVYYEAIIPSLQLNITRLLHKGPKQCVCEMAATLQCAVCHQKNGDMALDFCDVCKGISDQIHFRLDHSPILVSKSQKDEMLNLHSIICTRGNRFVSFVKVGEHRLSPWLFFDSMIGEYPEVTLLEDFGRWLDSLERQPGHYREFAKLHPLLKRIMTDSHIYVYSRTHMTPAAGQSESLVI